VAKVDDVAALEKAISKKYGEGMAKMLLKIQSPVGAKRKSKNTKNKLKFSKKGRKKQKTNKIK
jgi:hypothetical protein